MALPEGERTRQALPPEIELLDPEPLRDPLVILAFRGWSDGGDAPSTAVEYLRETLPCALHARQDGEEYFDFTVTRPVARHGPQGAREILWPDPELFAARGAGPGGADLLLCVAEEPHLRWRRFARAQVALAGFVGASRVLMLGAYLADVIYSQPIRVGMTATDREWIERFDLRPPRYEGSTGILSVLGEGYRRAGIPSATLWTPIPHYVATRPNPRGALALLERVQEVVGLELDLERLRDLASEFDDEVSRAISNDPELSAYVRELKRRAFSR